MDFKDEIYIQHLLCSDRNGTELFLIWHRRLKPESVLDLTSLKDKVDFLNVCLYAILACRMYAERVTDCCNNSFGVQL